MPRNQLALVTLLFLAIVGCDNSDNKSSFNAPATNINLRIPPAVRASFTDVKTGLQRQQSGSYTAYTYQAGLPFRRQSTTPNYQSVFTSLAARRPGTAPPVRAPLFADLLGAGAWNPVVTPLATDNSPALLLLDTQLSVTLANADLTYKSTTIYATGSNPGGILTGDFNGDGKRDVAVVYAGPAQGMGGVSILLGNGDGSLKPAVNYVVGTNPESATLLDFNNDGHLDLAVTVPSTGKVAILLGNADGTFQAPVNYSANPAPCYVAATDVNGDGKADLVVTNNAAVSILLGNGDGTFQTPTSVALDFKPDFVATGDFNTDGKVDLAFLDGAGAVVAIYSGGGNGTFTAQSMYAVPPNTTFLFAMDFDLDGNLDVVAAGGHPDGLVADVGNGFITVLFGRGDGTLASAPSYRLSSSSRSVAAADFNGDGLPDLVGSGDGGVRFLLGAGGNTFQAPRLIAIQDSGVSQSSVWVTTGDFNRDGKMDIAATVNIGPTAYVYVIPGNGDGTFQTSTRYAVAAQAQSIATGDFNGDGKLDLVVGGLTTVSVLLGNGDGTFQTAMPLAAGSSPGLVQVADVNGDGKPDLIVDNAGNTSTDTGGVMIFLGKGDGTFQAAVNYPAGGSPKTLAVGDLNGDGRPDIVVGTGTAASPQLAFLMGKADGTFVPAVFLSASDSATGIAIADINLDGKPDLVISRCCVENDMAVWLGNGDGTFQNEQRFFAGASPQFVLAADFNGDSKADIAVVNPAGSGVVSVFLNVTAGSACTFTLNRTGASVSALGDTLPVAVTATGFACPWTIQSGAQWISAAGSASRQGSGRLTFSVDANATNAARTGIITIAGQSVTVYQSAAGCAFTVDSQRVTVAATGGDYQTAIGTAAGCMWTPTAAPSWITVTKGASTGPGSATFTVAANTTNGARTGSVTVAGLDVLVAQSGANSLQAYQDVPYTHPYFNYIGIMHDSAITSGCSPSTYCPDGITTRGQMAVFVIRALFGETFNYPGTPFFTDVPATHPYFKYIQQMRQLGITQGCTATTFCPDDTLTRGQAAVFLVRGRLGVAASQPFAYQPIPYFTDVPTTHPYFGSIQKMKDLGITTGCSATTFCPDSTTTRGQMAVFVVSALLTP